MDFLFPRDTATVTEMACPSLAIHSDVVGEMRVTDILMYGYIYRELDHIGENLLKLKDDLAKGNSSELNGDPDQIKAYVFSLLGYLRLLSRKP